MINSRDNRSTTNFGAVGLAGKWSLATARRSLATADAADETAGVLCMYYVIAMDLSPYLNVWLTLFELNMARYLVVAGLFSLLFLGLLRHRLASRRNQSRRPPRSQYWLELRYALSTATIFASVGVLTYTLRQAGWLQFYSQIEEYGHAYWWLSLFLLILFHDTYFYWTHRLMHHPSIYRWVHRVHHRAVTPSPWTAYLFGPVEALTHAVIVLMVATFLPLHGTVILCFLIFMVIWNVNGHLGIELLPRGFARHPIGKWLVTSTYHNIHHRRFQGNFGLYFTFWDRLMGTHRSEYESEFERVTGPVLPRSDNAPIT